MGNCALTANDAALPIFRYNRYYTTVYSSLSSYLPIIIEILTTHTLLHMYYHTTLCTNKYIYKYPIGYPSNIQYPLLRYILHTLMYSFKYVWALTPPTFSGPAGSSSALMADYVDEKPEVGPNYYDWREVYPELSILKERYLDILEEARQVRTWVPGTEDH